MLKNLAYMAAALLPLVLGGCLHDLETRPYHLVPYCCDRTAGTGTEYDSAGMSPASIEPAAGEEKQAEKIFRKAIMK